MKYSLIHTAASIWITFGTILLCFFGAAILSVSQSVSRSDLTTAQSCKTWVLGFFNARNRLTRYLCTTETTLKRLQLKSSLSSQ